MKVEKTIDDLYQKAVFAENRHRQNEALGCYYEIYKILIEEAEVLTTDFNSYRISAFFYENKFYKEALFFAKLSVESGRNEGLSLYVNCCLYEKDGYADLLWLEEHVMSYPFFEESILYFTLLSKHKDVYQYVQHAFEHIESAFFNNVVDSYDHYVPYLKLMIGLEINEGNRPQARYYLRKWLLLEKVYLKDLNDMLIYALYLDDLSYFLKRKDTNSLLAEIEFETQLFYQFACKVHQNEIVAGTDLSTFMAYEFTSPWLIKKKKSYLKLIEVIEKESLPFTPVHNDWISVKAYLLLNGVKAFNYFKSVFTQFADIEEAIELYEVFTTSLLRSEQSAFTDVSVTVLGGGDQIGGSCLVISIGDSHLMIDAGAFVNSKESKSLDLFPLEERGITLSDLDGVIITHAHMDHIGNIHILHELCETVPIYTTSETKDLMWLMLKEQEKYDQSVPLKGLVDKCMVHIEEVSQNFSIRGKTGDWNIKLYRAGHIRGAVSVYLEKDGKSILITGDYSVQDQRTVKGLDIPGNLQADLVITESTYGFYPTSASMFRERQEKMFIQQLVDITNRGGTVLIPAFALGRAQEIISIIREYIPNLDFPVYLDGMVCRITELYDRYMQKEQRFVQSLLGHGVTIASKSYEHIGFDNFVDSVVSKGRCCVIASSGMLNEGTKSMAYAKALLEDKRHAIVFTGYLDEESPGFIVSQSTPSILIDGEKKDIKASVLSLRLSAHANREEILKTVLSLNPKHVMLVHGESKRTYKPLKTIGQPYPSVTDLLSTTSIQVIESQNGSTYHF
ncbi:MBL fold metallo-hydrolase [Priestia megaterium]|uniref:MBL fold metallo-hydrolase n=1 Tax=Priestia megaterium TaxID=1404 RepID=UPI0032420CF5